MADLRSVFDLLLLLLVIRLDRLVTEKRTVRGRLTGLILPVLRQPLIQIKRFKRVDERPLPPPELNAPLPGPLHVELPGFRVVFHQLEQLFSGEAESDEHFARYVFEYHLATQVK